MTIKEIENLTGMTRANIRFYETEGLIHLESMPFDELMARFERAFAVQIVLECDPLPVVDIISGEIRVSDGIDNALTVLQQMVDFTFEHDYTHNTIRIR